jgi:alkylated DNA repair protein alkB family protein 8
MMNDKKLGKKLRRKEGLLLRRESELGVSFQGVPGAHVLVSNGGLRNGVSRALLRELLSTPHIYMIPDKDYIFVTFHSIDEAETKVKALNGACLQSVTSPALLPLYLVNGPPLHLYLSYITAIPGYVLETTPIIPLPPGLVLLHNFITAAEEEELLVFLNSTQSDACSHLKHRRVFHYGYQFNYDTNNVDPSSPLPGEFPLLIQHLVSKIVSSGHVQDIPDQITVNHYPPGAGGLVPRAGVLILGTIWQVLGVLE